MATENITGKQIHLHCSYNVYILASGATLTKKRYVNPALELLLNVSNTRTKIYTCSFLTGQYIYIFLICLFCFVVSVEQWRTTPSVSWEVASPLGFSCVSTLAL